jgi:hypothetical protein
LKKQRHDNNERHAVKHVYPIRHPAELDATPNGETSVSRAQAREPALPHELDESSHSQTQSTPQQRDVGCKAFGNATDGTADTDRGPLMDQIYNEKVAPDRGPEQPRR